MAVWAYEDGAVLAGERRWAEGRTWRVVVVIAEEEMGGGAGRSGRTRTATRTGAKEELSIIVYYREARNHQNVNSSPFSVRLLLLLLLLLLLFWFSLLLFITINPAAFLVKSFVKINKPAYLSHKTSAAGRVLEQQGVLELKCFSSEGLLFRIGMLFVEIK